MVYWDRLGKRCMIFQICNLSRILVSLSSKSRCTYSFFTTISVRSLFRISSKISSLWPSFAKRFRVDLSTAIDVLFCNLFIISNSMGILVEWRIPEWNNMADRTIFLYYEGVRKVGKTPKKSILGEKRIRGYKKKKNTNYSRTDEQWEILWWNKFHYKF